MNRHTRRRMNRMADTGPSSSSQPNPNQDSKPDDNNSGQVPDVMAGYWDSPAAGTDAGDGNQAQSAQAPKAPESVPGSLSAFEAKMKSLKFGELVTPEMTEQLQQGDFNGLNQSMTAAMQNSVQQSLMMTAQMLNDFETRMSDKMKTISSQSISTNESRAALMKAIPSASNPAIQPIAEGIFAQALKKTQGDNAKAIEMTKQFMTAMTTATAQDLGINTVPPGTPGYGGNLANAGSNQISDWSAEIFGILKD